MCGIFGIVDARRRAVDSTLWARLDRGLRPRGPDDFGVLVSDGEGPERRYTAVPQGTPAATCTLAHWRLSILDLSPAGHQPMDGSDKRYAIVYNGEIYNYIELRSELQGLGHHFHSGSDTEVLLAAFAAWGEAAVDRLVGMYAFAIWDRREKRLFLARDPFGIKPLFVAQSDGRLAFGSSAALLQDAVAIDRKADARKVYEYMAWGSVDADEHTFFAGVRRFPAGAVGWVDLRDGEVRATVHQRYRLPDTGTFTGTFDQAVTTAREMFLDSVRLHLRSDVPLGAALSGGIDSSSIVMAMRHLLGPGGDIHAVAYVADDARISEERWIRIVAAAADVTLHVVEAGPNDLLADLDRLIEAQEEPFGSTSIYAQYRVFQTAAAAGLKVMLDGQGADELLAGYESLHPYYLAGLLRSGRPTAALRFLRRRQGGTGTRLLLYTLRQTFGLNIRFPYPLGRRWFDVEYLRAAGESTTFSRGLPGAASLSDALTLLFHYRGLPALLRYDDRDAMAHSVESRVPFLTPALVGFLRSLPESFLLDEQGISKSVFRAAMRGLVPDAILDRRDKIGFWTPEPQWVPQVLPAVATTLRDTPGCLPFVRARRAADALDAITAGRAPYDPAAWRLACLARWAECFDVGF